MPLDNETNDANEDDDGAQCNVLSLRHRCKRAGKALRHCRVAVCILLKVCVSFSAHMLCETARRQQEGAYSTWNSLTSARRVGTKGLAGWKTRERAAAA